VRTGSKYLLLGLGLLAFCGLSVYIFGAPTTGRQPIKFGALVIIASICTCYAIFLLLNEFWSTTGRPVAMSASPSPDPQQNFGRKQATISPTVDNPFHFEHFDRYSYVDQINELRMRLDSAPDYQFALVVESFPDAQASLAGRTTYFEFHVGVERTYGSTVHRISAAYPKTLFEPDFPARSEQLLDVIVPMICEVYARLSSSPIREYGQIPNELRPLLGKRQCYVWRQPGAGW
jgi:hypothetical protein